MTVKPTNEKKTPTVLDNPQSSLNARSMSTISTTSSRSKSSTKNGSSKRRKGLSKSKIGEKKIKPKSNEKRRNTSRTSSSKKSKTSRSKKIAVSKKSTDKKKREAQRKPPITDTRDHSFAITTAIAVPTPKEKLSTSQTIPKVPLKVKPSAGPPKDVITIETGMASPKAAISVRRRRAIGQKRPRPIDELAAHREFDECGCMGVHCDIVFSSFFVALASLAIDVILSSICSFLIIPVCSLALPAVHAGVSMLLVFGFLFQKPFFYIPFLLVNGIYILILSVAVVFLSVAFVVLMLFWDVALVNLAVSEIRLTFYASMLLSAVFTSLILTTLTLWCQMTISRARSILFFNKWREMNP